MNNEDRTRFWEVLTENIFVVNQTAQSGNHFREYITQNGVIIRIDVYIDEPTIKRYHGNVVVSVDAKQVANVFCYTNANDVNDNNFICNGRIGFSRQFNLGNKDHQDNWQQAIEWILHGVEFFC